MKLKTLALPLVAALVLSTTACSSGTENAAPVTAPRTKNAALTPQKRTLSQNPNNGVLSKDRPQESSGRQPSNTTVGVSIQSTGNPVLMPSDFCTIIAVECSSLNFAQVEVTGTNSFVASAVIPNASVRLPAGNGYAF